MSRPRLWKALALLGVVLWLVYLVMFPSGRMEVQLIMLGYTNVPAHIRSYENGSEWIEQRWALMVVTNTGSVPAKLSPVAGSVTPTSAVPVVIFGRSDFQEISLSAVVNPGEGRLVRVMRMSDPRWRVSLSYQRQDVCARIYNKAVGACPALQGILFRYLPPLNYGTVQSSWITNSADGQIRQHQINKAMF